MSYWAGPDRHRVTVGKPLVKFGARTGHFPPVAKRFDRDAVLRLHRSRCTHLLTLPLGARFPSLPLCARLCVGRCTQAPQRATPSAAQKAPYHSEKIANTCTCRPMPTPRSLHRGVFLGRGFRGAEIRGGVRTPEGALAGGFLETAPHGPGTRQRWPPDAPPGTMRQHGRGPTRSRVWTVLNVQCLVDEI